MAITKVSRNLLNTGVVNNTDGGIIVSTDGYGRALLLPADENGTAENNLHYIGSSSYRWRDIYLSGSIDFNSTAVFKANGSERMRIDGSGEIHINKTSTINNGQLEILAQTNHQAIVAKVQTNTYNNFLGYNSSGQVTSYIGGGGNYYFSGTNQSDKDLKENIQSITESSLEKVKQLEPKTFNFKESEGFQTNKKTGFIAQEVAEIFGTENGVATGTDGKKDMGIDSVGLIAHLTKAIQEQQAIIDDLKTRIEVLEA